MNFGFFGRERKSGKPSPVFYRTWEQWEAAFDSKESPADRRYDVAARAEEIAKMCRGDASFEHIDRECRWLARLSDDILQQICATAKP